MKQVALININSKCINNGVQQEPPGPKPVKETGKLSLSSLPYQICLMLMFTFWVMTDH